MTRQRVGLAFGSAAHERVADRVDGHRERPADGVGVLAGWKLVATFDRHHEQVVLGLEHLGGAGPRIGRQPGIGFLELGGDILEGVDLGRDRPGARLAGVSPSKGAGSTECTRTIASPATQNP